ncbi:uncharacterized protein LOC108145714 [Drosophila elegans]|uniref:uncharacterized protein LOC108145714 n=1 Tax=Drosophila elegans TaxID=30023 RepID=UPI0007E7ED20|nr:uncharacterized protein LOC108145714 [Drosophila elegans]
MDNFERAKKLHEEAGVPPGGIKRCCCNCRRKLDPYQLFDDNVEDIAKSLAQIMLICGLSTSKSSAAKSIIKRAFVYHERLRTTCPPAPAPGTRLHREDLLQALRLKCEMEPVEAMLTYSIIKRAFKAFYHGKPQVSISNPIVDAMAVHTQQAAWMHAAHKTSRIFDNYKAAFFWAHKHYERQINLVYASLYQRMTTRSDPLLVPGCPCKGCSKQEVPGHPKAGQRPMKKIKLSEDANLPEPCILCGLQVPRMEKGADVKIRRKPPRPIVNHEVNLPRCQQCNSPFLICECNIDQLTGEQFGECGQDSYKVKWYRLEEPVPISQPIANHKSNGEGEEDTSFAEVMEPPEDWDNHHCPLDCKHDSCSESSNVCHATSSSGSSSHSDFASCMDGEGEEDVVAQLEEYLNKLWAEEVAQRKNPSYVPRAIEPPGPRCTRCKD